jgi:hypothetical protein
MNMKNPAVKKCIVFACILAACCIAERVYSPAVAAGQEQAVDAKVRDLLRARAEAAQKALDAEKQKMDMGKSTPEWVYIFARRAVTAELEASSAPTDQIAARTKHFNFVKEMEQKNTRPETEISARYWRLNAEIELVRAQSASR